VNTLSYDYIKDIDLLKMETISSINHNKPIKKTQILDKLCKESRGEFQSIRYSLDNVRSIENLSVRMEKVVEENRRREANVKKFYSKYNKRNPFFIRILYPRTKGGNQVYSRKLPLEPHVNFYIDCYANH